MKQYLEIVLQILLKRKNNTPEDVDEMMDEHLRNEFDIFASSTLIKEISTVSLTWHAW